jgi:protein-disulfide isomerase
MAHPGSKTILAFCIVLPTLAGCQRVADRYIEDYLQRREATGKRASTPASAPARPTPEKLLERFADDLKKPALIPLDSSPVVGSASAPSTIAAFLDFQCPFSKKLLPNLRTLVKDQPSQYRLVFKHLPLASHSRAKPAALAAIAAQNQGKFWEMADLLFEGQDSLTDENFATWAKKLGLDLKRFTADMKSPLTAAKLSIDENLSQSLGIRSTPVTFLDGAPIRGALPAETLAQYFAKAREARGSRAK